MELFTAILKLGSTKKFEKGPVDEKELGVILYSATHAPSAGNSQEWEFIVVKDDKIKEKLVKAAWDSPLVKSAPVTIVVCADFEKMEMKYGEVGNTYAVEDASFATMNILLACHALGLGSTLIQSFEEGKMRTALNLRKSLKPVSIISIGHVAEEFDKEDKIPFENLTYLDYHGNRYEFEPKPLGDLLGEAFEKVKKMRVKRED